MKKQNRTNQTNQSSDTNARLQHELRALVIEYQKKIPNVAAELQSCYFNLVSRGSHEDLTEMREIVHKLVGSGATFGFPQISESAMQLEMLVDELRSAAALISSHSTEPKPIAEAAQSMAANIEQSDQLRLRYENLQSTLLSCQTADQEENLTDSVHDEIHTLVISSNNDLRHLIMHTLSSKQRSLSQRRYHVHCVKEFAAAAAILGKFPCHTIILEATTADARERLLLAKSSLKQSSNSKVLPIVLVVTDTSNTLRFEQRLDYAQMGVQTIVFQPTDPSHLAIAFENFSSYEPQHAYRVLLVDDDPVLSQFYKSGLKQFGIEMLSCLDYTQTLDKLLEFKPELILLDVHLGDCSGVTVAQAIRLVPEFETIPIILLSTDNKLSRIEAAKRTVADNYLIKPISAANLARSITPRLRSSRKLTELMTALRDSLTERMDALQEAKEARKQMGIFIATLAHEIRSPLQGILGLISLLEETNQDKIMARYLDLIKQSGTSLNSLITNVLDFSKMASGKLPLEVAPNSFEDLIQEVFATLAGTAAQNKTRLIVSLAPELRNISPNGREERSFNFDKARLYQVLLNLVSNSIKFTPNGLVSLCIQPYEAASSSSAIKVAFEVHDTGIGMTAAQRSRLFNPFVQVHDGQNQAFGGTGLGLTIAKKVLENMGSNLEVKSKPKIGSTFSFCLALPTSLPFDIAFKNRKLAMVPLDSNERSIQIINQSQKNAGLVLDTDNLASDHTFIAKQESAQSIQERPASSNIRVLVAEDQEVNQFYIRSLLEKQGCLVTLVTNGTEAIAVSTTQEFDLILLDCHMPKLDGFQAAAAMRKHGIVTPIYALTACPDWNERLQGLSSGMNEVLSKPLAASTLGQILRKIRPQTVSDTSAIEIAWDHVAELARIREADGSSLLSGMLSLWADQIKNFAKETAEACESKNQQALKAGLHRLKGSAANIGATAVVSSCKELEELANQMAWQKAKHALPALFKLAEQVEQKLADYDQKQLQWTA